MPVAGKRTVPPSNAAEISLSGLWCACRAAVWVLLVFCMAGCALVPDVRHKPQVVNPFPQVETVAVLPFFNQSQEPTLSGARVALAYMNEIQSIRGFQVLPLGALQSKVMEFNRPLLSGKDFQEFAEFMGVDAVVVGSITDYQTYYPPRMSMKVSWYAANPGFHPIPPGYGLPWGTRQEKKIPRWVHLEAQRALAKEQLKTQTPMQPLETAETNPPAEPILPEELRAAGQLFQHDDPLQMRSDGMLDETGEIAALREDGLPADWPDPSGLIPDPPSELRPEMMAQHEPIISHIASFNGSDEDFTEQLANYFYFRDDARFGGWQAYLQRSEDFIRFCCYLHLHETLISRGGQDKSRLIFRWPIDRYTR